MSYSLLWRPLQHPFLSEEQAKATETRILRVLRSWEGTPYMRGQQCKGVAVDCVRYLAGVADELYGTKREPTERLPHDWALHDPSQAFSALRKILRLYSPLEKIEGAVEAGDALVVGPLRGGPGHVIYCGPVPGSLWHAGRNRVERTSLSVLRSSSYSMRLFAVYRALDKDRWYRSGVPCTSRFISRSL